MLASRPPRARWGPMGSTAILLGFRVRLSPSFLPTPHSLAQHEVHLDPRRRRWLAPSRLSCSCCSLCSPSDSQHHQLEFDGRAARLERDLHFPRQRVSDLFSAVAKVRSCQLTVECPAARCPTSPFSLLEEPLLVRLPVTPTPPSTRQESSASRPLSRVRRTRYLFAKLLLTLSDFTQLFPSFSMSAT